MRLVGNGWKQVQLGTPYTVTADTVLEVTFRSTAQGEVHAIGFDTDDGLSEGWAFALYGTQSWGIRDFHTYDPASGAVTYTIPVGHYYTGSFDRLIFAMDHDVASPTGESVFSNIRLYEKGGSPPIAAFTPSCSDLNCSFSDDSTDGDGTIVARAWTFGDGGTSSAVNPSHSYAAAGTYQVSLTVTDDDGATDTVTESVTVSSGSTPPPTQLTVSVGGQPMAFEVLSYGGSQDVAATTEFLDAGWTLRIVGNGWKQVRLTCTVGAATQLQFQFQSTSRGEIHAIGFDTDDTLTPGMAFEVFGTQTWGIQSYRNYDPSNGLVTYTIPVGDFFRGSFSRLIFSMDHDVANPTGESVFSNITLTGCE